MAKGEAMKQCVLVGLVHRAMHVGNKQRSACRKAENVRTNYREEYCGMGGGWVFGVGWKPNKCQPFQAWLWPRNIYHCVVCGVVCAAGMPACDACALPVRLACCINACAISR